MVKKNIKLDMIDARERFIAEVQEIQEYGCIGVSDVEELFRNNFDQLLGDEYQF